MENLIAWAREPQALLPCPYERAKGSEPGLTGTPSGELAGCWYTTCK
jgi:hypothetical protein